MNDPLAAGENILVVDDVPANLRLLSQMLTDQGYKVRAVTGGARALASAAAEVPDLILLDIRMPELDGFEVCRQLKVSRRSRHVPVIFISALSEVEDKVQAFQAGGVDYITKPFQVEEVMARVETHLALRRLQKQLEGANKKFSRELILAGKIQASFLPSVLPQPSGWQLAAQLRPARETSGDFYDAFELPDGHLALVMADVVDKGVGAALFMALSLSLIRSCIHDAPGQPAQVLQSVNTHLVNDFHSDQFVTVFLAILDPSRGTLIYCNAGQNPPLLASPDGQIERLRSTGIPLGILADRTWEKRVVKIPNGSTLMLYTDGITEAENRSGDFYELARLESTLQKNIKKPAQGICEAIMTDIGQFTAGHPQSDDIALLVASHQ